MPYLRLTCPELTAPQRVDLALRLTDALVELFFDPRARLTRDDLREHTTVHFVPYRSGELFVGGQTPEARGAVDLTAELSDWSMSVRTQRRIARALAETSHRPTSASGTNSGVNDPGITARP